MRSLSLSRALSTSYGFESRAATLIRSAARSVLAPRALRDAHVNSMRSHRESNEHLSSGLRASQSSLSTLRLYRGAFAGSSINDPSSGNTHQDPRQTSSMMTSRAYTAFGCPHHPESGMSTPIARSEIAYPTDGRTLFSEPDDFALSSAHITPLSAYQGNYLSCGFSPTSFLAPGDGQMVLTNPPTQWHDRSPMSSGPNAAFTVASLSSGASPYGWQARASTSSDIQPSSAHGSASRKTTAKIENRTTSRRSTRPRGSASFHRTLMPKPTDRTSAAARAPGSSSRDGGDYTSLDFSITSGRRRSRTRTSKTAKEAFKQAMNTQCDRWAKTLRVRTNNNDPRPETIRDLSSQAEALVQSLASDQDVWDALGISPETQVSGISYSERVTPCYIVRDGERPALLGTDVGSCAILHTDVIFHLLAPTAGHHRLAASVIAKATLSGVSWVPESCRVVSTSYDSKETNGYWSPTVGQRYGLASLWSRDAPDFSELIG